MSASMTSSLVFVSGTVLYINFHETSIIMIAHSLLVFISLESNIYVVPGEPMQNA